MQNDAGGLFIGAVTLDLIYLAAAPPQANEKIAAQDYTVAAGGPATNAAVAFSALGNPAMLLGAVGSHPITQLIRADLAAQGVAIADLAPQQRDPPPVSSIVVTAATGERAVVSLNTARIQIGHESLPNPGLEAVKIILIDGHQMAVGAAIAQQARSQQIPIVIDGGSWKSGFETVLPWVTYAVCSANFYPPGCSDPDAVVTYLRDFGLQHIAITNGENPILYWDNGKTGWLEVPQVKARDTLGAGDIFHGAFCHFILQQDFVCALASAAKIASHACQFFGTRQWLKEF